MTRCDHCLQCSKVPLILARLLLVFILIVYLIRCVEIL